MMERIYHTWDKWECYPAGFYNNKPEADLTPEQCEKEFCRFFKDLNRFETGIKKVFLQWPNSCEHNLTNENLNRIAWLGQAAVCIELGIPSNFRSGFNLLTSEEQDLANNLALMYINKWMFDRGYPPTEAKCKHLGANQY